MCGVCAETVCGMCVLCFDVVVCCAVSLCVVLVLVLMLNVLSVVWYVCVVCVVCAVWCVCVVCVWRGLARGTPPVCRLKTSPCVGSKRIREYRENARVCSTCGRFAGTHGDVLTYTREEEGRAEGVAGVLFSLFLSFSSLYLFSLSLLSSRSCRLFSSLSVTMTMITRPVGSLCVHTALTCQSVRVPGPWPIPCWPNMFTICKKQLSWYNCASLVPLDTDSSFHLVLLHQM